jgi:hypothetical protein
VFGMLWDGTGIRMCKSTTFLNSTVLHLPSVSSLFLPSRVGVSKG